MYETLIYYNDRNDVPFSNDKIQQAINKVIAEEESYAYNITLDSHNVPADTFSQTRATTNAREDNENLILTSESLNNLDVLAETLKKGLTINNSEYY